jgi:hypothetical protein
MDWTTKESCLFPPGIIGFYILKGVHTFCGFYILKGVHTFCGVHAVSYLMGIGGFYPRGKAARV